MTRKITTLGDLLDRAVERSCERKKLDRDEVPALRQSAQEPSLHPLPLCTVDRYRVRYPLQNLPLHRGTVCTNHTE